MLVSYDHNGHERVTCQDCEGRCAVKLDDLRRQIELRYFRDVDGREVDFVVVERRKPIMMVEAKVSAGPVSPSLRYLKARFPACDAYQVHLRGGNESVTAERIHLWTAARFLGTLV